MLVVEGSIPNENNKTEGFWAGFGINNATGQTFADHNGGEIGVQSTPVKEACSGRVTNG